MFDKSRKMWLLECNDSPGMCETATKDADGTINHSCVEYNKKIKQFIDGTLNILGFDNTRKSRTPGFWDISSKSASRCKTRN